MGRPRGLDAIAVARPTHRTLSLGTPAAYRILVQGRIDAGYSDRLGGLRIAVQYDEALGPVSALEGPVADQAQLIGVLNTLYELRLPILEVRLLPDGRT